MVNFPASLDSLANPTSTTNRDDPGFSHAGQHATANDILEALEAKVGIGATTPDAQFKSPMASAAGVSAWGYSTMVKLGEVSGNGSSGVLEIASIPATFRHLKLVYIGRSDTAATFAAVRLTFETSPSAGAYGAQLMSVANTTVTGTENFFSSNFISLGSVPAASSSAGFCGSGEILLPEYANTTFYKLVQSFVAAMLTAASGNLALWSVVGIFGSGGAINRVRLTLSAGNWITGSRLSLYGIPG